MTPPPPPPPPPKRQKTQTRTPTEPTPPTEPVEPDSTNTCGICLTSTTTDNDNNNKKKMIMRGEIDSCEHLFCFVCIMEWAKVESRCPLCRLRFGSIKRHVVPGVFSSVRVVPVPVRDQVYCVFGNTTIAPYNPYAHIRCSVCSSSSNESLLLLCDLCDTASHTYCIGLGATVPEGDWYCHDCAVSRTEHASVQIENDNDNEPCVSASNVHDDKKLGATADVSIRDIVREPDDPFLDPVQATLQPAGCSTETGSAERATQIDTSERSPVSARTLSRCRNVINYIRNLRENWNALQSGSVTFSSCLPEARNDGISNDIDKAWKMMSKAKKTLQVSGRPKVASQSLRHLLKNTNTSTSDASTSSVRSQHLDVPKQSAFANAVRLLHKNPQRVSSNLSYGRNSPCSSDAKPKIIASTSHSNINVPEGKVSLRKDDSEYRARKAGDDAKSEIKILVKINLKLLSREKPLGLQAFKEAARVATHIILAACGFSHSKHVVRSHLSCICSHLGQIQRQRESTLMPNSCQECFYSYVKHVVSSVLSDEWHSGRLK